ncbi:MAG TPA: hypothetical protein VM266_02425 [Solirubrobacteraceae bacterium]|nr:hypothetical protein [Solirubrobacteraceae bacterium]
MARTFRRLIPALALLAVAAPSASAQAPLAGTGENIQPISRVQMAHPNEVELAGDWAFVSNDFYGMTIVNIADPTKPFIEGEWKCEAGWGDIDLSPDANLAFLTNAHGSECTDDEGGTWVAIVDISDKKNPKLIGTIPHSDEITYVHTATLDNNLLYLNPQVLAGVLPSGEAAVPRMPVYDVSDPRNPVLKTIIEKRSPGFAHDSYVDHRPDGKTLLYAGSVHSSDVFDVTDPMQPELLQEVYSPEITISHDVQPNHNREIIVVDDEGAAGGQLEEDVSVCGRFGGPGPAAVDSGSVHFYEAAPDGTFANGGLVELGSWNAPANANEGACVAHVFWQAPDENRLTQAYYRMGAFVLDYEDPAAPKMLGSFTAEGGSNYWSVKPHRGYLFATSQDYDALDIMRYTGEGGTRWPTTSGPAEIQRAARQGVPYKPITNGGQPVPTQPLPPTGGADERAIGRIRFVAKLKKVPGRRGRKTRITFTFRDSKGKKVGRASVRKPAAKRAKVRIFGGAVAGTYRWTAKAGKRTLGRGKIRVKKADNMTLAPNKRLSVAAR